MEDPPYYSFEKAFRWNDKFVYNGNCAAITKDCNSSGVADIATDTYNLVLHSPKQVTLHLKFLYSDKILTSHEASFQKMGGNQAGWVWQPRLNGKNVRIRGTRKERSLEASITNASKNEQEFTAAWAMIPMPPSKLRG